MTSFFKSPRLLPIVMVAGLALLTLKGAGILRDAQAAENAAAPVAAAAEKPAADPAQDDPQDVSTSEVDVLTSLSKRRAELDAREQDLTMRANLIAATEQRVDGKIAQLKAIQTQLTGLLQQRDAAQQKQVDALVKTYSSMKAKDAARIFNSLDEDVRLSVAQAMKPDVLAPILAAMDAETAQKLTVTLANHLKLPAEAAPAPTLASLAPPPSPTAASQPVMADQQPAAATTTPAPQAPQQSADASANPPAAAQAPANPPATPAAAPAASTAH